MPMLGGQMVKEKDFLNYVGDTMTGALIKEYPKMLYRAGAAEDHVHHGERIAVGVHDCDFRTVADETEELAALEEGWSVKPPVPETPAKPRGAR